MSWWKRLLRKKQLDEQLDKELRFHLEQHAAELVARGYDPEEARREARLELGGPDQVKESCRDARGTRWLEDLWQDFRYALRTLRQQPGFTVAALLTLALGVGATTVMFTVVNSVLLKPVPFPQPDRLVTVWGRTARYGDQFMAYPDYLDSKRESRTLGPMGAWVFDGGTLSEPGDPEYLVLQQVSADLFSTLGVTAFRGRGFAPDEDRPGGAPVAMLSYGFWQRRFAGSPSAVGATMVIDAKRYTITGIMPPDFHLDVQDDVYVPLGQNTAAYLRGRAAHPVRIFARLRPGATLTEAHAELALLGRRLAQQYPATNAERAFEVQPMRPDIGDVGSTLWLLLGAVGLVLLIGCVNVASLLLARAVSRERELAMRAALGAGQGRLIRQCLTESAVLGLSGGLLGLALAMAGIRPFVAFWPGSLPRADEVQLDWRVLLFALTVSLASGLLFGLAPALRAPSHALEQALRASARTLAGSSRRLHSGFVISEVSLAVVLLVSAGMLGRTLLHLSALNPGLNIQNILTARMALSAATLANPAQARAAWDEVLSHARQVPGVESTALVDTVPMRDGNNPLGYWTSASLPPDNQMPIALATSVTPDYLKVTGIGLHRGRFFDDHDRLGNELVAVIDEVLAANAFGAQDPIGQRLWIPDMGKQPFKIVGVVGHVRYWGLGGDDQAKIRAQVYYSFAQVPDTYVRRWSELMSIIVRTTVPPLNVVQPLRRAVRGAAGDQVVYEIHSMEQLSGSSLARQRFLLLLFGVFAGVALLLACIGIYGVLAYLTSQRVPEMGVRMALGASARNVKWLVLRQSLGMIFLGVGVGAAAALAASRVLLRMVEGMQPTEPMTFTLMISVLVAAALVASFLPAQRASRIDPMTALRQE